jgi:predicted RNase H-like nuclease (RuvC/YqgF family)
MPRVANNHPRATIFELERKVEQLEKELKEQKSTVASLEYY